MCPIFFKRFLCVFLKKKQKEDFFCFKLKIIPEEPQYTHTQPQYFHECEYVRLFWGDCLFVCFSPVYPFLPPLRRPPPSSSINSVRSIIIARLFLKMTPSLLFVFGFFNSSTRPHLPLPKLQKFKKDKSKSLYEQWTCGRVHVSLSVFLSLSLSPVLFVSIQHRMRTNVFC